MAEKYAGKGILGGLMKNVLSVAPSSVLTEEDVQKMWNGLDTPVAPIEAWNYSLNNEESSVTLQQYVGSEENVTVYASYDVEAATYNTKIASNDDNSEDYMFAGNDTVQTVTFEEGVDTSETVNMSNMFASCMSLRRVNLSAVNTENTTSMANMFSDCESLEEVTVDTHNWVVNDGCDTTGMFEGSPVTEETYVNEHEYDETDHCTTCGHLNPEHQHSYVEEITTEPTCETTGVKTFTCSVCGDTYTEEIPALGHDFGEFITDVEATCDTAGSKSQHCSRCDATQNVTEIPAWGHDYEEPVYTWSDDLTQCTASRTCSTDGHVDTETVNTVSEVTTEPGCESTGVRTYTAEFTNEAFAKQLKTETIDALGHEYESVVTEPTCETSGFTTHTCTRCGHSYTDSEVDALGHDYTSEITTEPTCTSKGIKTYTCSRCGNTYTEEIPMSDHNFVNDKCSICGVEVGSKTLLSNWSYGLDKDNNVVNLLSYHGNSFSETDVTVYGAYNIDDVIYKTKLFYKDNNQQNQRFMFNGKSSIKSVTFKEGIDISDVTSIAYMFYRCTALTTINGLENLDVSNVQNMNRVFAGCSALTSLDLTGWDTSNVTDMTGMFNDCSALTGIKGLNKFNTTNVTTLMSLFNGCAALISLDLTGWDTSKVTSMYGLFFGCSKLALVNVTTGKWVVNEGCDTSYMFMNAGISKVTYRPA